MEQVESGDLIVNRGRKSQPRETGTNTRELNAVEGYKAGFKLAQVIRVTCSLPLASQH
jgi:hypothetical protein